MNPAVGGPIESVKQSSAALVERGHSVEVISLDAPTDPWVKQSAVQVHGLGPGRGSYGYSPGFVPWLRHRRLRYDAVIVHGIWQYSSFGVWRALHRTATPYFVFPHGMLDPWFKRTYPLKHLKKLLYWPWGDYRVLRDAAAVLFTSEEERQLARQSFSLYDCNGVVVNYGTAAPEIDLEAAERSFFEKFPELRGKRFLLFLGRLHEKKGCEELIQAFRSAIESSPDEDLHLLMAGPSASTDYFAHLKRVALNTDEPRGKHISFAGMLTGDLKWGAFSAADAFVLPSHQENFGIAVVEALACGTPVLVSNKVNIWREIVNEGAGLADQDDRAGAARLIQRWRGLSAEHREMMRSNARRCFKKHFEITAAVDSLLDVLASPNKSK
jgi:glycosyltransferase involved in cell wall biosynthesis